MSSAVYYSSGANNRMTQVGFPNPLDRFDPFPHLRKFFANSGAAEVTKEFILPDVQSWQSCGRHPGISKDCGSTVLNLPFLKGPKIGGKTLKKSLKSLDDGAEAGAKGKRGTPSGCKCFLAGTKIRMADGKKKNIEDIKVGERVLATNPETGKTGEREVTAIIVTNDDKQFTRIEISTLNGDEKLTATHEHPFW